MTADEIANIEGALDLKFPSSVLRFLGSISDLPTRALREAVVLQEPAAFLELNIRLRKEGFYHIEWPPSFFAVGTDPGNCTYFIDLRSPHAPVFFADYDYDDISEFKMLAENPERFALYIREIVAEWEEEERRAAQTPTAANILSSLQGDSKSRILKIVLLSNSGELERWWLDDVGWNADEPTVERATRSRLDFLITRAKSNGWDIGETTAD